MPALDRAKALTIADDDPPTLWPQAQYLAAIVQAEPSAVAGVLVGLKTNQPGTVKQLLQVALELPDDELLRVAKKAKWLRARAHFGFLAEYIRCIGRVANAMDGALAFSLARRLFALRNEPPRTPIPGFEHDRAVPVVDGDWFESVLAEVPPLLVRVDPIRTLKLLADTLDLALRIEGYDKHDVSGGWYPDMLDQKAARYEAKAQITGRLVDLAFEMASSDSAKVLAFLDGRAPAGRVYERLAFAVLARGQLQAEAVSRLYDVGAWSRGGAEHRALVEVAFPIAPASVRSALVETAYPVLDRLFRDFLTAQSRDPEDVEQLVLVNIASCFGTALDVVPEPYRSRMKRAVAKATPATRRAVPDYEQLANLAPLEVVRELATWLPETDTPGDPTWSIGNALRVILEQRGLEWLAAPDAFLKIPDYYLGWALNGLHAYRRMSQQPNDEALLAVLEPSLARALALIPCEDKMRRGIARHIAQSARLILADVARQAKSVADIARVVRAAQTLAAIHPTRDEGKELSPWAAPKAALGDPRGLAVYVAGELLVAANTNHLNGVEIEGLYGDLTLDAPVPVRGALGHFFSWFVTMFPGRAEEWAQRIFLSGAEDEKKAAWAGYVTFSNVNATTHRLLRRAYGERLADLQSAADGDSEGLSGRSEPTESRRVKEQTLWHIWVLLANRIEPLSAPESLSARALQVAAPGLVKELLGKIPTSLRDESSDGERNRMINEEAMALFKAVQELVAQGRLPATVLSAIPRWLQSPLPAAWRFERAEELLASADEAARDNWDLVCGLIDLSAVDRKRGLSLLERLAKTGAGGALTAIQQYAGPLLRDGARGDADERYFAHSINSVLVNNHRPDLLSDLD